jgi:hypothetical protein
MITSIDENLGRLRDGLDELGLARDTILIFFGDNGTSGGCDVDPDGFVTAGYNAGMRGRKSWAFEGGHRNACFIHWPGGGLEGGRDVAALSAQIDLLPTLIELCGFDAPPVSFDGRSLADILTGEQSDHTDDRTLIVHNQQRDTPLRYKDFQAMTSEWRLAETTQWGPGKRELFRARRDPGQSQNVLPEHPEVADRLVAAYEQWWESVSERFEDTCPIYIGGTENPVKITCHAWHGTGGLYSQNHVREGAPGQGYWLLEVTTPGRYEFRLSRWPEETGAAIRAPLPARTGVPHVDDLPAGVALAISQAEIQVGDHSAAMPVAETDTAATFQFTLPAGRLQLETSFIDEAGGVRGAYYVYVERLADG